MNSSNHQTIALTGATGFLGSHLLASLLKNDYRVIILGRSSTEETLEARITKLLRWFHLEDKIVQVELYETDLLRPKLGLSDSDYSQLNQKIDQFIHCASDTSFSERKRSQIFEANVSSLKEVLEFASKCKGKVFNYISTAYVAGVVDGKCLEELPTNSKFYNAYEESKAAAENLVSDFCNQHSIGLRIIRPSIVYGDSKTGHSLKFNALYYHFRSLQNIRDIYLNDIKNRSGIKSTECGIFINDEGYLNMPLRIYLPHEGSINLIPIDFFVEATLLIVKSSLQFRIYHITTDTPSRIEVLAQYIEEILKIKGIEVIYQKSNGIILRNPPEELFDRFIEPYRPYLSDTKVFERSNITELDSSIHAPVLTFDIFKRCMDYAISTNWGEKVFD